MDESLTRPILVALRASQGHFWRCLPLGRKSGCIRWQETGGVGGPPPTVALFVGPAKNHPV